MIPERDNDFYRLGYREGYQAARLFYGKVAFIFCCIAAVCVLLKWWPF